MKTNLHQLFQNNKTITIQTPPSLPEENTNYILQSNVRFLPYLALSLGKQSNHRSKFVYDSTEYHVTSRKCIGSLVCPQYSCNYSIATSSNMKLCSHHGEKLNHFGKNCSFKIYFLVPKISYNTNKMMMTTGRHDHVYFPQRWTVDDESKNQIDKQLLPDPSTTKSNLKHLKNTIFFNNEKFDKIMKKRKEIVFGIDQSETSLFSYEKQVQNGFETEEYNYFYEQTISEWIFPFVIMANYFHLKNEFHFVSVMFCKFQCLLLLNSNAIHIDTKHKTKPNREPIHHFGICVRTENFGEAMVDEPLLVLDAFISKLDECTFHSIFSCLLNRMKDYEIDTAEFIKQLEAIVSDFSISQNNGVKKAISIHLFQEKADQNVIYQIYEKFKGCYFHFKQSVARLKRILKSDDKSIFESSIEIICKSKTKYNAKRQLELLEVQLPITKGWCKWWMREQVLSLLWNCFNGGNFYTNNNIENIHSNQFTNQRNSIIVEYKSILDSNVEIYNKLTSIFNNQAKVSYSLDLNSKRITRKLNARIRRERERDFRPPDTINTLEKSKNQTNYKKRKRKENEAASEPENNDIQKSDEYESDEYESDDAVNIYI